MRLSDAFPGGYLKAADLDGKPETPVTIKGYRMDKMDDGVLKPVLQFQGTEKELVLNITNGKIIAQQHGEDLDQWAGKQITLCVKDVEFKSDIVPAIRVRTARELQERAAPPPAAPAPETATPVASPDDDLPF